MDHSPEVHNEWTQAFVAKILFGNSVVWDLPVFKALQAGFNISLSVTGQVPLSKVLICAISVVCNSSLPPL